MNLPNDTHDEVLTRFEQAVVAFCQGERERGDRILSNIDLDAIEHDRRLLSKFARKTARPLAARPGKEHRSRSIPRAVKEAVQRRDRYHCRFTGRRLIDTRIFHEVARISSVFHFDSHHSVKETSRGAPGHPIVRTHGAAYEHAEPFSWGGASDASNIVQTSVELNECKGTKVLNQVDIPKDTWNGMTEYLDALRRQPAASAREIRNAVWPTSRAQRIPEMQCATPNSRGHVLPRMHAAASGIEVIVFALENDRNAEEAFSARRHTHPNAYFATQSKGESWRIHRLHCSSLQFNGAQKLTASPKIYALREEDLREWARRFGVTTTECRRCRQPT